MVTDNIIIESNKINEFKHLNTNNLFLKKDKTEKSKVFKNIKKILFKETDIQKSIEFLNSINKTKKIQINEKENNQNIKSWINLLKLTLYKNNLNELMRDFEVNNIDNLIEKLVEFILKKYKIYNEILIKDIYNNLIELKIKTNEIIYKHIKENNEEKNLYQNFNNLSDYFFTKIRLIIRNKRYKNNNFQNKTKNFISYDINYLENVLSSIFKNTKTTIYLISVFEIFEKIHEIEKNKLKNKKNYIQNKKNINNNKIKNNLKNIINSYLKSKNKN